MTFFNKAIIKLDSNWRITSNFQYSNSSNVPRFDKLNDGNISCVFDDSGQCVAGEHLEFHSYYYGPQKRLFSSLKLTGFDTYFDKSEFIVAYQKNK
jgi:hemoglobin/transferrin/lactoferrin receptor protein